MDGIFGLASCCAWRNGPAKFSLGGDGLRNLWNGGIRARCGDGGAGHHEGHGSLSLANGERLQRLLELRLDRAWGTGLS